MGGVKGTRYLHPIHFCNIRTQKMSKLKMLKSNKKIFQDSEKSTCIFSGHPKSHVKFQKDRSKTVGGVKGTRYLLPIDFCNIRNQKMSKFKTCKK